MSGFRGRSARLFVILHPDAGSNLHSSSQDDAGENSCTSSPLHLPPLALLAPPPTHHHHLLHLLFLLPRPPSFSWYPSSSSSPPHIPRPPSCTTSSPTSSLILLLLLFFHLHLLTFALFPLLLCLLLFPLLCYTFLYSSSSFASSSFCVSSVSSYTSFVFVVPPSPSCPLTPAPLPLLPHHFPPPLPPSDNEPRGRG